MSQAEATRNTIRLPKRRALAGFNSGTDLRHGSACGAMVAGILLSLLAVSTVPAVACERSIHQSNTSTSNLVPASGAPEATASAFDPATLPSIGSIDAKTDITAFLQSCVPAELRLAALRRAWTVDPAIRDFKELSENDWNFNDPNSIVGFGELGPEVDVNIMVAQIFGEPLRLAARPLEQLEEPRRTFSSLANAVWRRFLGVTLN